MSHPAGKTFVITVTPGVGAAAYATGDVLGTGNPLKLEGAARTPNFGGVIIDVVVADNAAQSLAMDILFFRTKPTSVFTDNGAVAVSAADNLNCVGVVSVLATDYVVVATGRSVARVECQLGFNIKPTNTDGLDSDRLNLWAVAVTRGAPTYGAGNLQIMVKILQD